MSSVDNSEIKVRLLTTLVKRRGRVGRQVARGRGVLSFFLGDADVRYRLFVGRVIEDRVLVACLDGKVAGFLTFQFAGVGPYAPKRADFCACFGVFSGFLRWCLFNFFEWRFRFFGFYICTLKVFPKFRRRGVASALMVAAEAHALRLGASVVYLEVNHSNFPATQFYAASGFKGTYGLLCSNFFGFSLLSKKLPCEMAS